MDTLWQAVNNPVRATFRLSGPALLINSFNAGLKGKKVNPEK